MNVTTIIWHTADIGSAVCNCGETVVIQTSQPWMQCGCGAVWVRQPDGGTVARLTQVTNHDPMSETHLSLAYTAAHIARLQAWTLTAIAAQLGVSLSSVSSYRRGEKRAPIALAELSDLPS